MDRRTVRIVALLALCGVLAVVSLAVGPVSLSWVDVVEALRAGPAGGPRPSGAGVIVWQLRLPRVVLGALVGLGLGAAGAAYQGLFRNPLADPFVIGASSGSALGATLVIVLGGTGGALGWGAAPLGGFVGSLAAAALVYATTAWWGRLPLVGLLLAGSAVSSCLGALVWLLMVLHDDDLARIVAWLMGSLAARGDWATVRAGAPYLAVGGLGLGLLARPLDALSLGEEPALALGMPLRRMTGVIVASASLVTAAAVALAGVIGFIGLIAPHLARALVGSRHRYLLPASALTGAVLLIVADDLARTVAAPSELPVGVLTALLGGPFFLLILGTRAR